MAPHNLTLTLIGASLLWVGWFGFNAGSAVAANGRAGMAMVVTQLATARRRARRGCSPSGSRRASRRCWASPRARLRAWSRSRRRRASSASPGALDHRHRGGRAAASSPPTTVKRMFELRRLARCVRRALHRRHRRRAADRRVQRQRDQRRRRGRHGAAGRGRRRRSVYSGVGSFIILKVIDMVVGLRVSEEQEREGLDISLHGERRGARPRTRRPVAEFSPPV